MAMFNFDLTGQSEAKKAYYEASGREALKRAELLAEQAAEKRRLSENRLNDLERAQIRESDAKYNTSLAQLASSGNDTRKLDQADREWNDPVGQQKRQAEVDVTLAQAESYKAKAKLDGITAAKTQDELESFQTHRNSMAGIAGERGVLQAQLAALETASQNPAFAGQIDAQTLNSEKLRLEADLKALDTAEKIQKTKMVYAGIGAKVSDAALNYLVADAMGVDPLQMKEFALPERGGAGQSSNEPQFEYTQSLGSDYDATKPKQTIKFKAPLSQLPNYNFGENASFNTFSFLPKDQQRQMTQGTIQEMSQFLNPFSGVNPASTGEQSMGAAQLFGQTPLQMVQPTQPTQPTQATKRFVFDPQTGSMKPQ